VKKGSNGVFIAVHTEIYRPLPGMWGALQELKVFWFFSSEKNILPARRKIGSFPVVTHHRAC